MPLVLADRVKETTTTTGTGTVTLLGAVTGFSSFAVIGNGNTTYYTIAGQGTSEWEVGIGTYTSSGTTLSRDTVLASSAGAPTKTNFSGGTKDVFVTYTAARSVNVDGASIDTFGLGAAQGDILYASGTDNFVLLNKNTTATRYLANTGTSNNPAWAQVNLTNGVTGTLPVGNGGTGATTLTSNNVILGNGASAVQFVAPGANGNVLTSNGTTWTSAAAGGGFAAGTAMLFVQTAAPTGWTKSTTHDNKALRVVSGTASSGGSVAFTTAFASQTPSGTIGSTTLSTNEMPSHNHQSGVGRVGTSGLIRSVANAVTVGQFSLAGGNVTFEALSSNTGGGGSHNHSFTGTAINLAVQYVDVIIATKD